MHTHAHAVTHSSAHSSAHSSHNDEVTKAECVDVYVDPPLHFELKMSVTPSACRLLLLSSDVAPLPLFLQASVSPSHWALFIFDSHTVGAA